MPLPSVSICGTLASNGCTFSNGKVVSRRRFFELVKCSFNELCANANQCYCYYGLVIAVTVYQSIRRIILKDLGLYQHVIFHHIVVAHHSRIFELICLHLSNITFFSYEIQIHVIKLSRKWLFLQIHLTRHNFTRIHNFVSGIFGEVVRSTI